MVAKITIPISIRRVLNYNEQKMKEGKAVCISAQNFLKEVSQLNFYEKLHRFEQLICLNKRATTNTVHISLNFSLNEKLEKEKLSEIAADYMQKIGFGNQPYLVYQHLDAGHPHIHIVTTNIKADGKRISLHNLGRTESSKAREEIEKEYGLIKTKGQLKQSDDLKPLLTPRITYGKSATKRGITNVLDAVLLNYKYTSLAELNAVLRLYNVVADRGKEDGIIFNNKGLIYRVLDEKGNKIGVPIKASSIYSKPTLPFLEKRFKENEALKLEHKKHLKTAIDWILVKPPKNLHAFKQNLQKEKISLVIRQNDQGLIYGLTYIDHHTKCVFNGSDIGKDYSAKGIMEKCGMTQSNPVSSEIISKKRFQHFHHENKSAGLVKSNLTDITKIVNDIITPIEEINYLPYELKKRKKKKK